MSDNWCVVCSDPIPEGRQVCPICEARAAHGQREEVMEHGENPGDGAGEELTAHVGRRLGLCLGRRKRQ